MAGEDSVRQPADCDLGSRKSARQCGGDWDKSHSDVSGAERGSGLSSPFVVDTPARVTPLAALLVRSLFVQFAQRQLGAESESWYFELPIFSS